MFEVFNPVTGKTFDVVDSVEKAEKVCRSYGQMMDYEPIRSAYWVFRNGKIIPKYFLTENAVSSYCDFENMASDTYTYSYSFIQGSNN